MVLSVQRNRDIVTGLFAALGRQEYQSGLCWVCHAVRPANSSLPTVPPLRLIG
jgi:hypothetical protein